METWKGFKDFIVDKKVKESPWVCSFYLKSIDENGKLPQYYPGQFIAVRVPLEDGKYSKPRQYTLSTVSNGEYYRISVKREQDGDVSIKLCDMVNQGDKLQISAPAGKFILKNNDMPILLIGGGIGITPMLTMSAEAVKQNRITHLIFSIPNSEHYIFGDEIQRFNEVGKNFKSTIVFTRPTPEDKKEHKYQLEGRLTKEWLEKNIDKNTDVYFCGPFEFMRSIYHFLIDIGVSPEHINYELFAPSQDITK